MMMKQITYLNCTRQHAQVYTSLRTFSNIYAYVINDVTCGASKCCHVWSKCCHVWSKCCHVWSKCCHVWHTTYENFHFPYTKSVQQKVPILSVRTLLMVPLCKGSKILEKMEPMYCNRKDSWCFF